MFEAQADAADVQNGQIAGLMYQHLTYNCYPPHPEMQDACVAAVEAGLDDDYERMIDLPKGVVDRRTLEPQTPAFRLIESFHLEDFIDMIDAEEF
jgi:hypothetical protein